MPAKPFYDDDQYDILRATAIRLLKNKKRFRDQEQFGLAIGVSQQSVSGLVRGTYRPGLSVSKCIAQLDGQTLEELIGPYGASPSEAPNSGNRPNLEACITFHAGTKQWHPWTLAAARAGIFGPEDLSPPAAWTSKLDALEAALAKVQKGVGGSST